MNINTKRVNLIGFPNSTDWTLRSVNPLTLVNVKLYVTGVGKKDTAIFARVLDLHEFTFLHLIYNYRQ